MKTSFLLLILLGAVIAGTLSFHHKFRGKEDDIDRIEKALTGAKKILSEGSAIGFSGTTDIGIRAQSRFVLAPEIVLAENMDTLLWIYPLQDTSRLTGAIIWRHSDTKYKYYLTAGAER
ncbi:MAG: hypothetical protein K8F30_00970 [Taibaiella sp.]|nr:hypothetical protein [Taibaiella sp.]